MVDHGNEIWKLVKTHLLLCQSKIWLV
jgi:hypothetical protein